MVKALRPWPAPSSHRSKVATPSAAVPDAEKEMVAPTVTLATLSSLPAMVMVAGVLLARVKVRSLGCTSKVRLVRTPALSCTVAVTSRWV